jgi:hypothetical protein
VKPAKSVRQRDRERETLLKGMAEAERRQQLFDAAFVEMERTEKWLRIGLIVSVLGNFATIAGWVLL